MGVRRTQELLSPEVLAAVPPLSFGPRLLLGWVLRLGQAKRQEEEDYLF